MPDRFFDGDPSNNCEVEGMTFDPALEAKAPHCVMAGQIRVLLPARSGELYQAEFA